MKTALAIVHILLCLVLISVVLMQHRKQGGFGGLFGGGSQADVSSNQWQRFTALTKITVVVTALFMLTSVFLVVS
ncbi:MAG: preprotein translocase subunit SecG [Synergistales bacterium]|nr:preprotein translocase subunit SecG [Synergistales bacterium]